MPVTGNEFIRRVKALARQRGMQAQLSAKRGKGSHQTLYLDTAFTIIRNPKDALKTGTMHAMVLATRDQTFRPVLR